MRTRRNAIMGVLLVTVVGVLLSVSSAIAANPDAKIVRDSQWQWSRINAYQRFDPMEGCSP